MLMQLVQRQAEKRTSVWKVISRDVHQCGNVRVIRRQTPKGLSRDEWRIEVRTSRGKWVEKMPKCRPWGYSGPGAAKRGAALMCAWERGVAFR